MLQLFESLLTSLTLVFLAPLPDTSSTNSLDMASASYSAPPAPTEISPILLPLVALLSSTLTSLTALFHRVPGSPIVLRYIKSSYQDDPWRSLLEVLLVAFALRTLLKGRTRGEGEGGALKLSQKVRVL